MGDGSLKPYVYPDTSKSYNGVQSAWRIQLLKSDAELTASGRYLPNKMQNAKAGDHFFLINIALPHEYVLQAEQRVTNWLNEEIVKTSDEFPTYTIKPSAIFMERFAEASKMKAGAKIRIADDRLVGDTYLPIYIQSMRLDYRDGKALPNIELTVSDKVVATRNPIELLQSAIQTLSSGAYSAQQIAEMTKQFERFFIRKDIADTATHLTMRRGITLAGNSGRFTANNGISNLEANNLLIKDDAIINNITLHKGISSEIFFPGFLGEGMELFKDENGNWNFTLDNLTVRKQMNVFELVINKIKHVGGAFLFSPAGGTFTEVVEYPEFWRCYVEDKNNNEFEIYDQVICQTFTKNRLKRYWRLAVNVGEDFVDLSKTDCESGSAYPEIDDEAVVLGNRVNKARQNAVLISSYGDDGSYQQFLNGVDTYSLADKIDIHFGKESFMRVNRLEIKGTDGKSERVPRDRGIFQLGETYEFYDRVVYNGRYWLCLAINTTSAPSDGEWQEQTNVRAGGKNLLREHDLRFDGKYWQGSYDSQFIDLSMLSDYLFNGNNDAIVTEGNIYIEL